MTAIPFSSSAKNIAYCDEKKFPPRQLQIPRSANMPASTSENAFSSRPCHAKNSPERLTNPSSSSSPTHTPPPPFFRPRSGFFRGKAGVQRARRPARSQVCAHATLSTRGCGFFFPKKIFPPSLHPYNSGIGQSGRREAGSVREASRQTARRAAKPAVFLFFPPCFVFPTALGGIELERAGATPWTGRALSPAGNWGSG